MEDVMIDSQANVCLPAALTAADIQPSNVGPLAKALTSPAPSLYAHGSHLMRPMRVGPITGCLRARMFSRERPKS